MDMVNLNFGQAVAIAIVGICFVFAVLVLLLVILKIFSAFFAGAKKPAKVEAPAPVAAPAAPAAPVQKPLAKGSCGDFKLHDVEPKQAAMVMAIVADKMQTPLNELRFKSIKKVESEEK